MKAEFEEYLNLMEQRPELFLQSKQLRIILDEDIIQAFEKDKQVTIGVVYKSPFNLMVVDLVEDIHGNVFTYERVVPTSTGKGVVALTKYKGNYLLLKQYRHSLRNEQYAFVRGFGENDLVAEENVKKELMEELHCEVSSLTYLGEVVADSGLSGNLVSVYLCEIEDYSIEKGYEGIEDVRLFSKDEMKKAISEGEITDGFTLSAYAMECVR